MRFKLFGYFLIFLSCVYIGFSITKHYRYKIACSQAYLNMLTSIFEKIEVLHLPLSKIYESCNDTQLEKVGFLKTLKEDGLKKAYDEYESRKPKWEQQSHKQETQVKKEFQPKETLKQSAPQKQAEEKKNKEDRAANPKKNTSAGRYYSILRKK